MNRTNTMGNLQIGKELFYVLGALLGDGYAYNWRKNHFVGILVGEEVFAKKFANKISKCIKRKVNAYFYARRNLWFVRVDNIELFMLFRNIRKRPNQILGLFEDNDIKENVIEFIEGFFDAEGCVKIIKEKVRKTPKICLDFANTNYDILGLIRTLLADELKINARFSKYKDKRKNRKMMYHLRIYKKSYIREFLKQIKTIKLKEEKISFVDNWFNNGK